MYMSIYSFTSGVYLFKIYLPGNYILNIHVKKFQLGTVRKHLSHD